MYVGKLRTLRRIKRIVTNSLWLILKMTTYNAIYYNPRSFFQLHEVLFLRLWCTPTMTYPPSNFKSIFDRIIGDKNLWCKECIKKKYLSVSLADSCFSSLISPETVGWTPTVAALTFFCLPDHSLYFFAIPSAYILVCTHCTNIWPPSSILKYFTNLQII